MRSRLYRHIGWTGGSLLTLETETATLDDSRLASVAIDRGGADPSSHDPSTATIDIVGTIPVSDYPLRLSLTTDAATWIADRCMTTPEKIAPRFHGRRGRTTSHDIGFRRTRQSLEAASWDALLRSSPDTAARIARRSFSVAVEEALNPSWIPTRTAIPGTSDKFAESGDPIVAADLISLLESRLYLFASLRQGDLEILPLEVWRKRARHAVDAAWPLSRSAVLAPLDWAQTATERQEYWLEYLDADGTWHGELTAPDGIPTGTVRQQDVDWTDTLVMSDQWERIKGLRAKSWMLRWSAPRITVRLDHLIGSPKYSHRRTAGMLLSLDVGQPVALAGDWPVALGGVVYTAAISETITPHAWTMTLGLIPTEWLDGDPPLTPRPRTWDQSRDRWDDALGTWNEGPQQ